METLQARRSEPFYMLDNAQSCLDALAAEPEPAVPTVPPLSETTFARTLRIAPPTTASGAYRVVHGVDPETARDLAATDTPGNTPPTLAPVPASPPPAVLADPELLSLFIEEAGEEVAKIGREFPRWDENPLEDTALATVRRSFQRSRAAAACSVRARWRSFPGRSRTC